MGKLGVTDEGAVKTFPPVFKKPCTLNSSFNFVETVHNDLCLSGGSMNESRV